MSRNMSYEVYSTSPDGSNFPRRGTSLHGENLTLPQVLLLDKPSMGDQTYHGHPDWLRVTNAVAGTVPENSSLGPLQGKPLSSLGVEELKRVRNCVFENSLKARERIDVLKEAIYKLDIYHKTMLPRERSQIDLPAPVPNKQVHTSIMDMQVREAEDEDVILISPAGSNRTGEVSKNKCHLHKLEKAVFKRQKVEDREHEVIAMNKIVESAHNRHMDVEATHKMFL